MKLSEIEFGTPVMYDKHRVGKESDVDGTSAVWVLSRKNYREANQFERNMHGVDFIPHVRGASKRQFCAAGVLCIAYNAYKEIPEDVARVLSQVSIEQVEAAGMTIPILVKQKLGEEEAKKIKLIVVQPNTLTGPSWAEVRAERADYQRRVREFRTERARKHEEDTERARRIAEALRRINGQEDSYRWVTPAHGEMSVRLDDLERMLKMLDLGS